MLHKDFTSEQELFRQVSEGSRDAFRTLFDLYNGRLFTFIHKLTKSETATAELVQDLFVKLWISRTELKQVKNVQAYLFTMASNKAIDHLRKMSAESRMLANLWNSIAKYQQSAEEEYNMKECNELINQAMLQLSPQKQKIFKLSRYEGLNHEEIATELSLSKSTVKNHLVDTLRHIKDYMNVLKHW